MTDAPRIERSFNDVLAIQICQFAHGREMCDCANKNRPKVCLECEKFITSLLKQIEKNKS